MGRRALGDCARYQHCRDEPALPSRAAKDAVMATGAARSGDGDHHVVRGHDVFWLVCDSLCDLHGRLWLAQRCHRAAGLAVYCFRHRLAGRRDECPGLSQDSRNRKGKAESKGRAMSAPKPLEPAIPFPSRRAKIVCTLGPSSNSEPVLRDLMRLGMDVARLNFSHGTHEEHARTIERLRKVAEKEGRTICILQDLQGPKIRTGRLKYRTPVALKRGSHLTITPRDIAGTATVVSTTFKTLAREVEPGSRILLSDGLIELLVIGIHSDDVQCEVINGGRLGEHKGINLPGVAVNVTSLTEKDEKDLEFGLKHGVDIVAVSFVRSADDVRAVKRFIQDRNGNPWVIAKLE